jgi:hypothetical protein
MWEKLCFFHISMTQHKHSLQSPFKTPFFHTLFDITAGGTMLVHPPCTARISFYFQGPSGGQILLKSFLLANAETGGIKKPCRKSMTSARLFSFI